MTLKCSECDFTYDPEERAKEVGPPCTVEDWIEGVPFHHDMNNLGCDGTGWPPENTEEKTTCS